MVYEPFFDNNQTSWTDQIRQMAHPIQGNEGEALPMGPEDLMTFMPIGMGAQAGKAGTKVAAQTGAHALTQADDAARIVYNALLKAGVKPAAARDGARQGAAILKSMEARGAVDLAQGIDRAVFLGAMRAGVEKSAASKIAAQTAKTFAAAEAPKTVAQASAKFTDFGAMLKKIGVTKRDLVTLTVGGILFAPIQMIFRDFWQGTLDLTDARAQSAVEFYVNGKISKETFESNIDDLGYDAGITAAWKETGETELKDAIALEALGPELGITRLATEERKQFAGRVTSMLESLQKDALNEKKAADKAAAESSAKAAEEKQMRQQDISAKTGAFVEATGLPADEKNLADEAAGGEITAQDLLAALRAQPPQTLEGQNPGDESFQNPEQIESGSTLTSEILAKQQEEVKKYKLTKGVK